MGVRFNYRLEGSGSAACNLSIDDQSALLTLSYVSDGLGDLVRAVVDVLDSASESEAWLAEKPGEHRWLFSKPRPRRLRVRIFWYHDYQKQPDHPPPDRIELDAECRLRSFAGAILAGALQIHRQHGERDYLELWRDYPFPTELVARLKSLLDAGAGAQPAGELAPFIGTLSDDEASEMQRDDDACGAVSEEW
jgi:hypothetical protein